MKRDDLIVVRGGGDLATGVVHRLWSAGLRVLVLETAHPAAIRRQVSLCEAVYEGETAVEGMRGIRVETLADADAVWAQNAVPILIDPTGACLPQARPAVLVDAIIAKKNLGTTREMAPLTIALGPGFAAGQDVDVVVETKRGHKLGRIIREGPAAPNSGVPGIIGGYGAERVLHAQAAGIFRNLHSIADFVEAGEAVAEIETPDGQRLPVITQISGILRGLLRDGYPVTKGFKVADVDPRRAELENCFLISDKSRCTAGSVLELTTADCWNSTKRDCFCNSPVSLLLCQFGDEHLIDLVALEDELLLDQIGTQPVRRADVQTKQLLIQCLDGAADGAVAVRLFGDAGAVLGFLAGPGLAAQNRRHRALPHTAGQVIGKLLCDLASFFGDGIAIFLQRDQLLAGDIIQTGADLKIVDQLFFHQRILDLRPGDRPGILYQITQQQPDLRAVGQPAVTNTGGKSIVGGHRSAHPPVISNCCPALPRGRP